VNNKRKDSFFKSDRMKVNCEDENRTNSTFSHNFKYDTNNPIVQLDEPSL